MDVDGKSKLLPRCFSPLAPQALASVCLCVAPRAPLPRLFNLSEPLRQWRHGKRRTEALMGWFEAVDAISMSNAQHRAP